MPELELVKYPRWAMSCLRAGLVFGIPSLTHSPFLTYCLNMENVDTLTGLLLTWELGKEKLLWSLVFQAEELLLGYWKSWSSAQKNPLPSRVAVPLSCCWGLGNRAPPACLAPPQPSWRAAVLH